MATAKNKRGASTRIKRAERRTDVSLAHGNVLTVRALQTGSANVLLSSSHLSSAPYFFFLAPI